MELCLAGLFFLVRDANDKAACTVQGVMMIVVTVLTGSFHYALDHSHWIPRLSFPFLRGKMDRIGSKDRDQLDRRYKRGVSELSIAKQKILQADFIQDEALRSPRPVVWIPKDDLGIAEDEICHVRKTHDSLWMSDEGASLDERGKLKLCGNPPERG